VIYDHYHVTITGSISVNTASGETKLQFRIEGEIEKKAVRMNAARKAQATIKQWRTSVSQRAMVAVCATPIARAHQG
jgi:hypothetical protein